MVTIPRLFATVFAVLLIANFFILGPPWRDEWRGKARGHNNLGLAYQNVGRIAEAKEHYIAAIKKRPGYSHPFINMGTICEIENDNVRAMKFYKVALMMDPKSSTARWNYANTLFYTGNDSAAVNQFFIVAGMNVYTSAALNNAGYILDHMGRQEEAIATFSDAMKADPNNQESRRNFQMLKNRMQETGKLKQKYQSESGYI